MVPFIRQKHPDFDDTKGTFSRDGYVVFKPEIPEDVLQGAHDFTEQVYNECIVGSNDKKCRNMHQGKYTHVPAVRDLATNFHIRAMMAVLHSHEPYPFQTLNYPCTSLARTHSDYVHFAAEPQILMSAAWVALIDVQEEAGPVFYYPGSHRLDSLHMQDVGLAPRQDHPHNYARYQDVMTTYMEKLGLERKTAVIPRGHCLIWSANLVHGGPPATMGGLKRFSQVTHYFYRRSSYNWAPIMSDVHKGDIVYYDEASVRKKWENSDDPTEQDRKFDLSKFRNGACDDHYGPEGTASPCDLIHRVPFVMSDLLTHTIGDGEVLM